jgi:cytoskeleton protein RodZ
MSARPGLASPGLLLRAAREARGLAIEEVADRMRLNVALVLAMEEDRLGLLGAPVFARGHLRNYALLVGAPEREVMAAFEAGEVPEPTLLPTGGRAPVARTRPRRLWIAGFAVLAAAAAAALAWWMTRS